MHAKQNATVSGAGNCRTFYGLAKGRIVPYDLDAAVGVVGLDRDISGAVNADQLRRVIRRRPRSEVAGRGDRPPAKMTVGRLAIHTADIEHVDQAFGGEIYSALAQRLRRASHTMGSGGPKPKGCGVRSKVGSSGSVGAAG